MRFLLIALLTTTQIVAPAAADHLRDVALEYFEPLPDSVPDSEGYALTPERVALGKSLFHDARLSSTGLIACNSCHDLANGGDDGRAVVPATSGYLGGRNTTSVLNVALNGSYFWDGRSSDLALQLGGPVHVALEWLNTPKGMVKKLRAIPGYRDRFTAAFPQDPDPLDHDNIARALDAYLASLLTPSPFDAWLKGVDGAISANAEAGLELFIEKGCAFCHYGPNLGGLGYYPFGLVERPEVEIPSGQKITLYFVDDTTGDDHMFRTSPLRNVALTAPYFHAGQVADLATAVVIMSESQLGGPLKPSETAHIVAFLESLTGTLPDMTPPDLPPDP